MPHSKKLVLAAILAHTATAFAPFQRNVRVRTNTPAPASSSLVKRQLWPFSSITDPETWTPEEEVHWDKVMRDYWGGDIKVHVAIADEIGGASRAQSTEAILVDLHNQAAKVTGLETEAEKQAEKEAALALQEEQVAQQLVLDESLNEVTEDAATLALKKAEADALAREAEELAARLVTENAGERLVTEVASRTAAELVTLFLEEASTFLAVFGPVAQAVLFVVLLGWTIYEIIEGKAAKEKAENKALEMKIAASSSSADIILQERCINQHDSASKAEGLGKDEMTASGWNEILAAFAPHYHSAYRNATDIRIQTIANTEVVNWGTPAVLPEIPYIEGFCPQNQARIKAKYALDTTHYKINGFLDQLDTVHKLMSEHRDAVHATAFHILLKAENLPYAADSIEFAIAYIGLYTRLSISEQCMPLISENEHLKAQFKLWRIQQSVHQTRLKFAAHRHFAARSAVAPTLPAPAVHQPAYAIHTVSCDVCHAVICEEGEEENDHCVSADHDHDHAHYNSPVVPENNNDDEDPEIDD